MKLSKVYEPSQYEVDIYALWEKSHAFAPTDAKKSFSVVVPPPNANGNLHIGHALTLALEDIAVRYHRMKGESALLLPGADHAGFETQVVYEKQLAKEGKTRFDFTREALYKQIWDFVAQNRTNFEGQVRRLGAGVDWDYYTFTLDEKIIKRAYATFKRMWDEKLIYRGEKLVNYCTFHRTGFADIEVVHEDATTPLYYMQYGPFVLATTRPETKFGDTAVAVHPDDKRYQQYVGKVITVEGVNGPFEVQVIADEMVDPQFGTGVVKITPAHSFDDWEVAQRHDLPVKRIINHDGTLNHLTGRFEGMTVLEARKAVVEALKEKGLLIKIDETYRNRIGKCYKCGTIIEPMLMEQWFLNTKPLAEKAIDALHANEITFYPDTKKNQLISYLQGLRDWNLSRQIAWGIPIPAFQNVDDTDDWIYDDRVDQEIITIDGKTYRRDPDVFDTWFSSSSWPYATLDYPDGEAYEKFYPLSLMETGGEILYPWVSRMVMLGLYVTGKIPFENVYIHGYVLAEDGAKMSKSLGNVINPLEVIEKYGSDALRMGVIATRAPAINRGYDQRKVEDARNFCNKLWNVARYIEDRVGDNYQDRAPQPSSTADHWILTKLHETAKGLEEELDNYQFAEAYDRIYHFVWDDFADWYIEASKAEPNAALLAFCLESILILLHPFAPFLTETIWQTLSWEEKPLLVTTQWPLFRQGDNKQTKAFEQVRNIVGEIRFISKAMNIHDVHLCYGDDEFLAENAGLIQKLSRIQGVISVPGGDGIHLTTTTHVCWLDIDPSTTKQYIEKLAAKQEEVETSIGQLKARLSNKSYVEKAPRHVVGQTRAQLTEAQELLTSIQEQYDRFSS